MSWLVTVTRTGRTLIASCVPATAAIQGVNVVDYNQERYRNSEALWLAEHAEHWPNGLVAVFEAGDFLPGLLASTRFMHVAIAAMADQLAEWYPLVEHFQDPFAGAARPVGYPDHLPWPPPDKAAAAAALREPVDYRYYLGADGIPVDHTGAELGDVVEQAALAAPPAVAGELEPHEASPSSTGPGSVFPDDDTAVITPPEDQPE